MLSRGLGTVFEGEESDFSDFMVMFGSFMSEGQPIIEEIEPPWPAAALIFLMSSWSGDLVSNFLSKMSSSSPFLSSFASSSSIGFFCTTG
jgi:hypothetical protein